MSTAENTLFLRLAGFMQSWGTSSRFQLRRTDGYPSKSGVLGLLLCAKGIRRKDSREELERLSHLSMGVRVDRSGTLEWDYHTVGAKIGIRRADGEIKKTEVTGKYETLLSRRQYLYDASFLVVLHGDADKIGDCAHALENPIWPVYLGRKCCVPSEPVFAGLGFFDSVSNAISSIPWQARIGGNDRNDRSSIRTLDVFIEHAQGTQPPEGARLVYDIPKTFGFNNYEPRWVVAKQVDVPVDRATQNRNPPYLLRQDPYGSKYKAARPIRLKMDNYLCVFCKSPAVDVHHLDYEDVRPETLRSLCKICHDACTMIEYGNDLRTCRIDPSDPKQRSAILLQIKRLLTEQRLGHRRELLETTRTFIANYFDEVPDFWVKGR